MIIILLVLFCCAIFHIGFGGSSDKVIYHKAKIPPVDLRGDLVIDQSYHLWLFHLSCQEFCAGHSNWRWYSFHHGVIRVEFMDLIRDWSQIGSIEKQNVKAYINKYGYRWVYEQDQQLSNSGTYYYYIDSFFFLLSCLTNEFEIWIHKVIVPTGH